MKSVTICSGRGIILFKVIHKKNGQYELSGDNLVLKNIDLDVRNDKNQKVSFYKPQ